MTGKIVNLNTARKQADRTKKRTQADANAAKFGRTKAQRKLEETEADMARNKLDQHKREEE
ncbi:DUF4169 family protein [Sinirhodobacter sp. WL0062]|uniref:DUF4169 family protein n=1 Tax=Rhodobacter flavimaris TaxID=2907145 RepID=A0ABS8YRG3_9RHOB|nr:DUF4169 family protein [Sinirhodobacter sp. WL0062]